MEIYVITNLVNGKKYVGKTRLPIERRWQHHLSKCKMGSNYRLYQAIRKYGINSFKIESVATTSSEETLSLLEREWITKLDTYNYEFGYNMTTGGDGWSGNTHTEETRRKIGRKSEGRPKTEKFLKAISAAHKDKPKSVTQRRKMAAYWDEDRRERQAEVARRVNAERGDQLKDYTCDLCNTTFHKVRSGVFGGHRKACKRRHGIAPKRLEPLFDD